MTINHSTHPRARDLNIPFEGVPGRLNAITDVAGVTVGYSTLISGDGPFQVGKGPVRTGVTAILPRGKRFDPVFAGWYALNGNGEMTGTIWVDESGFLEGPVILTNTNAVGLARDAVIAWQAENDLYDPLSPGFFWLLPVVAETFDGYLNDIFGFHVRQEHVFEALDSASSGPLAEGNVGGGTGMICFEFKGGTGTASRVLPDARGGYTVGALVQANHGTRSKLQIGGLQVGQELDDIPSAFAGTVRPGSARPVSGSGSVIAVIATDAPLLPHQLNRLARRVPLGLARLGSNGEHYSGDIFLAFSTANPDIFRREGVMAASFLSNDQMTPLFDATVQAVEEAVVNAMVGAETMTGRDGRTAYALPRERLRLLFENRTG